ncbi:diguanylate cyclase domain-containing protein [Sulfurimonas sp.]|uniref:diguanylate cyclase domain-containing protein n=1 Tax=Sulfurimonas sp. TaxID=2022749 RepID=UPI0039E4E230
MEHLTKQELISIINANIQEKENLEFLLESLHGVSWEFDLAKDHFIDVSKNAKKLFGFNIDSVEKKKLQENLEKEHKFLQATLNGISDPVMIIKSDYNVEIMNDTVKKQLQSRVFADPSSPKCYEISHYRDTPCEGVDHLCPLKDVLESKKAMMVLHNHRYDDGRDNYVELAASPLFDEDQNCIGIIESARNVTQHITLQHQLEAKTRELEYEATHDYLTGLPNRALFMDRLEQIIKDLQRDKGALTLFFMDLDHFKAVNDTFGHHMGDAVLKLVCKKFQACLRANDTLSRLAGDEFTVILKGLDKKEAITMIAQKFIDIFDKPLVIDEHELRLSVSIGISVYSGSSESADTLLQKADAAMYIAKAKGKNNFQFMSLSPSIL